MMKWKILIFLTLFTIYLNANALTWYPLNIGNTWTYQESDGEQMQIMVSDMIIQENQKLYELERYTRKGNLTDKKPYQMSLVLTNQQGYASIGQKFKNKYLYFKEPLYEIKYPLIVGHQWVSIPEYATRKTPFKTKISSEIMALDDMVTTPAGTFKALKIRMIVGQITYFRWYAQNIGMVKEVFQSTHSYREKLLTQYRLIP